MGGQGKGRRQGRLHHLQGNKLLLTLAAEAQAKSGHDIMEFTNWEAAQHDLALEPVDDVIKTSSPATDRSIRRSSISAKFKGNGSACR